jgi:hypothetical protein
VTGAIVIGGLAAITFLPDRWIEDDFGGGLR